MPRDVSESSGSRRSAWIAAVQSERAPTAQRPSEKKRKTKKAKKAPPPAPSLELEEGDLEYGKLVDPSKIRCPVENIVHPKLSQAWTVQQLNPMWFIFDSCTPARHFKRGMPFNEDQEFPAYSPEPYDDLTETDQPPDGLMPFAPILQNFDINVGQNINPWSLWAGSIVLHLLRTPSRDI